MCESFTWAPSVYVIKPLAVFCKVPFCLAPLSSSSSRTVHAAGDDFSTRKLFVGRPANWHWKKRAWQQNGGVKTRGNWEGGKREGGGEREREREKGREGDDGWRRRKRGVFYPFPPPLHSTSKKIITNCYLALTNTCWHTWNMYTKGFSWTINTTGHDSRSDIRICRRQISFARNSKFKPFKIITSW